jgi:hypothetical protein
MMRTQANPAHLTAPHDLSGPGASVAVGEIRTGLLRHSAALTASAAAQLLDLLPGELVDTSRRPIEHVLSPNVANGVDCQVVTDSGSKVRAVGTVLTHAAITGGRVLQTSTFTHIDPAGSQRRQQWAHYTAQPGRLETLGKSDAGRLAAGFTELTGIPAPGCLDLGSVCERLALRLQASPVLDGRAPIKFQWTRLRWSVLYAAKDDDPPPTAQFTLLDDTNRVLNLFVPHDRREAYRLADVLELCRDIAQHDWVLTTLTQRIERIRAMSGDRPPAVGELQPIVSNLLHLWLPGARVSTELAAVWDGFERRPGFTRQWQTAVEWIRDQLSLHTLRLLGSMADREAF